MRNAFAIRTSETSAPDEVFARYFAPEVLDVLPQDLFARSSLVIRSSPGAGKTSLLRIFTPGPLLQVIRNRQLAPHDEIFRHLKNLNVVSTEGALAFAVLIPCASGYSDIGSPLEPSIAKTLFRSLVNVRVVLRFLRSVCTLNDLAYPSGLADVVCEFQPSLFDEGPVPRTRSAAELRQWAEDLETKCFARIDSVGADNGDLPLHRSFDAVVWLSQVSLVVKGRKLAARPIVMFDDVHRLRPWQRHMLYDELLDHRSGTPVWLAERTIVLSSKDVLTSAVPDRDYLEIRLEDVWPQKHRQYLKFVTSIADRRVALMKNELESFADHLANQIPGDAFDPGAVATLAGECRALAASSNLFGRWLDEADSFQGNAFETAIEWMKITILITREKQHSQRSLELEPLPVEQVEPRAASGVAQAAERLVSTRFQVPYFYGIERVARLSSFNVDEFLQICAELYEYIHAQRLSRKSGLALLVPPKSQEAALRKIAERRLNDLSRQFALGPRATNLLNSIGAMCIEKTYAPSAPYAPGVTGIAISTQDHFTLLQAAEDKSDPFHDLANLLSSCVAQNIFEVKDNLRQDNKRWLVLYLNRLFCVHYNLVYHTGGWQRVSVRRLKDWMQGEVPKTADRIRLV